MKKYTKFIQRALTFSFKKISFTKVVQFLQSSSTLESTINWGVNVAIKLGRKLIDDKNQLKIILKTQQTAIELEKNYGVKRKQTYFWLSATSKILKSIIKCLYLKKDDNGFCVFSPTRRLIIELFKDHEAGLVYQEYLKGNIDKEILSHTVYEDKDLVRGLVLRIPELQQYVYWMKNPTL